MYLNAPSAVNKNLVLCLIKDLGMEEPGGKAALILRNSMCCGKVVVEQSHGF